MKRTAGFTLVELSVALSIVFVIGGIVVVRADGFSSRQTLLTSAHTLGSTIRLFREKAQEEELLYALRIDLDRGTYTVTCEGETVRSGKLGPAQVFGKVLSGPSADAVEVKTPVVLNLTPRGLMPETRIAIRNSWKETITLSIAPSSNEVSYAESDQ